MSREVWIHQKLFELALCNCAPLADAQQQQQQQLEPDWQALHRCLGGSAVELQEQFEMLLIDVGNIDAGLVVTPDYGGDSSSSASSSGGGGAAAAAAASASGGGGGGAAAAAAAAGAGAATGGAVSDSDGCKPKRGRAKGTRVVDRGRSNSWTPEEHKRFLHGLVTFGKGDWRSISRHSVITRTPTQVASHAQKFFKRQERAQNTRRRNSIHDITIDEM